MEEVDREISEMKLSLNARARIVAESYLTAVRSSQLSLSRVLTVLRSLMHNATFCYDPFLASPTELNNSHRLEAVLRCNPN